ncbi:hypothetical protein [Limnohabitans sp. T6-5]|uniref:hypothetical protein n=1 Tax=Limnohabitans sp. T6-5 TaxID=1100724 RepID=UPI0011B24AB1|nr:hypothetical protein [Limnohabitans sp. T6-5]
MNKITQISTAKAYVMATLLGLLCHPSVVSAGVLSKGICRPYKMLVDNELFVVLSVVASAILLIAWKLAPSGQLMTRAVGVLAALSIALNIETLIQIVTGVGLFC